MMNRNKFPLVGSALGAWAYLRARVRASYVVSAMGILALTACISYRPEVVQGNLVTKEMVAQLRPGMDSNAVLNIMGTPLITSVFHENRWDYVFTFDRQGLPKQHRSVTLHFKDQRLDRIEGGQDLPSENEFAASLLKK